MDNTAEKLSLLKPKEVLLEWVFVAQRGPQVVRVQEHMCDTVDERGETTASIPK